MWFGVVVSLGNGIGGRATMANAEQVSVPGMRFQKPTSLSISPSHSSELSCARILLFYSMNISK
jgi:hypothetical protein